MMWPQDACWVEVCKTHVIGVSIHDSLPDSLNCSGNARSVFFSETAPPASSIHTGIAWRARQVGEALSKTCAARCWHTALLPVTQPNDGQDSVAHKNGDQGNSATAAYRFALLSGIQEGPGSPRRHMLGYSWPWGLYAKPAVPCGSPSTQLPAPDLRMRAG